MKVLRQVPAGCAAVLVAALLSVSAQAQEPLEAHGFVRLDDGDSFKLTHSAGVVHVRLWGIDAPEAKQACRDRSTGSCVPCGELATGALATVTTLAGREVYCRGVETGLYGRLIARCFALPRPEEADQRAIDLSLFMVRGGWAMAYRRYLDASQPEARALLEAEAQAQAEGRVLHRYDFVEPERWRRGERLDGCE